MAEAARKGWQPVDNQDLVRLVRRQSFRYRQDLEDHQTHPRGAVPAYWRADFEAVIVRSFTIYTWRMDPRNKSVQFSKYADTEAVINAGTTKGQFSGAGWRIKV